MSQLSALALFGSEVLAIDVSRSMGVDAALASGHSETVKNITVSLPDDVYRRARIRAAERDVSVSALVREFLMKLGQEETETERRKRLQAEVFGSIEHFSAGDRLRRDEVHERRGVR